MANTPFFFHFLYLLPMLITIQPVFFFVSLHPRSFSAAYDHPKDHKILLDLSKEYINERIISITWLSKVFTLFSCDFILIDWVLNIPILLQNYFLVANRLQKETTNDSKRFKTIVNVETKNNNSKDSEWFYEILNEKSQNNYILQD